MKHTTTAIFITVIMILSATVSAQVITDKDNQKNIFLRYKPVNQPLKYLTTFYSQTTDLVNVSDQSGTSKILKKDLFDYIEAVKEQNQHGVRFSEMGTSINMNFIKNENQEGPTKVAKPLLLEYKHTNLGRLVNPFDMENFKSFGIPSRFPGEMLKEGTTWKASIDFVDREIPPLTLNTKYTFKKLVNVGGRQAAEVDFEFNSGLKSTKISNDPLIQQKIAALQKNNIEYVAYDGKGTFTLDFETGHMITQNVTMTKRMAKAVIKQHERLLQELVTVSEFAEALIP